MTTRGADILVVIVTFGFPKEAARSARLFESLGARVLVAATSKGNVTLGSLALPNIGYGAAANAGFLAGCGAETDWFLVLNDDLDLDANTGSSMLARLGEMDEDVALWSFTGASSGISPRRRSHPTEHSPHGAALAIRSAVFATLRGFDPLFFLYGEEVDLWLRLGRSYRSGYEELPGLVHAGGGSSGRNYASAYQLGRSTLILARKHSYTIRGLVRVLGRGATIAIGRRKVTLAMGYCLGALSAVVLPSSERAAQRDFGAEPLERRANLGRI